MTQEEREELLDTLHDRMEAELEAYTEKLLKLPPAEILENAHRLVLYGELMDAIDRFMEEEDLDAQEVRALAELEYPLDAAYLVFVDTDRELYDVLRECVQDLVEQEAPDAE